MAAMVEGQLSLAIDSFWTGNVDKARQVVKGDQSVNSLEVVLDDACNHVIVRRQPAANDLRVIVATLKVITDLERIGDEATKIARNSIYISERDFVDPDLRSNLHLLIAHVVAMLHESLDIFACMDAHRATELIRQDKVVDSEFRSVMLRMVTSMSEDPRSISPRLDILWIAKALERIGDHSKNIAEYVVFAVLGRDIRHTGDHAGSVPESATEDL